MKTELEYLRVVRGFILSTNEELLKETNERIAELEKAEKEPDELEVGRWYKHHNTEVLFITKKGESSNWYGCYGFNCDGEWMPNGEGCFFADKGMYTLASDKEVESALVKEAIKRGFKDGVSFRLIEGAKGSINSDIVGMYFTYESHTGLLIHTKPRPNRVFTIFKDGVWAEPIELRTYSIGQTFNVDFVGVCILSQVAEDKVCLISLKDGNRVREAVLLEFDCENITQKELDSMSSGGITLIEEFKEA